MRYITSTLFLFVIYLVLTGNLETPNLVLALIVAGGISLLMPRNLPVVIPPARIPRFLWAALRYFFVLIRDIIVGGIMTIRIVLSPKMPLKPGILAISSRTKTELGTAMSAHAITLSPGELVIAMDSDGVMYAHCLDVEASAAEAAEAETKRSKLLSEMFE